MQQYHNWSDESILEDITLPGLAELKGHWYGSLDASGGGNGDTMVSIAGPSFRCVTRMLHMHAYII